MEQGADAWGGFQRQVQGAMAVSYTHLDVYKRQPLYLPLFLNDAVPEEHKSGIDMGRDLLRRSHVLVVCGHTMTEAMKNDIAVAQRLGITATTLEGIQMCIRDRC